MQKKCRRCGDTFKVSTHEDYCPTCAETLSKPYKKEEDDKKSKLKQTLQKELDAVQKDDVVNHPSHYTRGKIEVIDFIEDQQFPYHLGNVIKYISRAGHKGDKLEDLKKAQWYLARYIELIGSDDTAV